MFISIIQKYSFVANNSSRILIKINFLKVSLDKNEDIYFWQSNIYALSYILCLMPVFINKQVLYVCICPRVVGTNLECL